MDPSGVRNGWTGHGFGLALASDFDIAGCPREPLTPGRAVTRLERVTAGDLRSWPKEGAETVSEGRDARGRQTAWIGFDPELGYLMTAPEFGSFWVSPDGLRVRCAPARSPAWRWQRYLLGQVLPFTATLRGFEVLHASAVAHGRGALAIVGRSGAGKTSVAAELVSRGAELIADDVVALEMAGERVIAHPALGVANLRGSAADRLGDLVRPLGRLGAGERAAVRAALPRSAAPAPLDAIYVLERCAGTGPVRLLRVAPPDPLLLLSSTFVVARATAEQRVAQLDVCARTAASARLARLRVPTDRDPADVAARIVRDA